jgi:hypothetical protein
MFPAACFRDLICDPFRGWMQDNPLGSMLIAGAIGFALALLMTRPPRRPPQRWR